MFGDNPLVLQEELNKVQLWCIENLLKINCRKSQWMRTKIIGKNIDPNTAFRLGTISVENVNEYKYLGLLLDSCLNFRSHIDNLINRVNLKIIFFKKIRRFITSDAASLIYKATILPIVEYADFVFDHHINYISAKLQ